MDIGLMRKSPAVDSQNVPVGEKSRKGPNTRESNMLYVRRMW